MEREDTSDDFSHDTSATLVESCVEDIQLKDTDVAIYVLDKTLYTLAEEIKKILTQDKCKINVCDEEHQREHIGDTIAETSANFKKCGSRDEKEFSLFYKVDIDIRGYGYLDRLITEAKQKDDYEGLYHDVIILLGHSSVLLAEDKDLIETFAKLNPTIIAFVGCCGGNTRYGPILTMSYMLHNKFEFWLQFKVSSPIIAFYQRQVYMDELFNTSLIIGLQYYLHICYGNEVDISKYDYTKKDMAKFAFALAKLNKSVPPTDPTVFINDRKGKNPVQMILHKCDLTTEAIPLSCMQLAMYSPMVVHVDPKEFRSDDKWLIHDPSDKSIPTITLPKGSCLEHKLVIDDVLWQLDQQKIKITIHGAIPEINIETHPHEPYAQIRIYKTLPKQITVSEDPKSSKASQWTVSEDLQGIEVTLKTPNDNSEISCDRSDFNQEVITFNTSSKDLKDISIYKHGTEITFCIPKKYTSISQDQQSCETQILIIDLDGVGVGVTVDELSKVCSEKIETLQLHRIIPLVCEIKFIKLLKDTLKLMRTGDKSSWEKIDPLQFLIAALRGHWGKNSLTDIKTWATYHLKQIMKNVKSNSKILHQYELCCVCFVLLCEDSFVKLIKPNNDITICTKKGDKLVDVTDESFKELPDPGGQFPTDGELAGWVNLFQHCKYEPDCVKLKESTHPIWKIGNYYRYKPLEQLDTYQYSYNELLLCLGALSSGILSGQQQMQKLKECYHIKQFFNKDEIKGYMEYFDDIEILKEITGKQNKLDNDNILYFETIVLLDTSRVGNLNQNLLPLYQKNLLTPEQNEAIRNGLVQAEKDSQSKSWKKVSSCRFVFAQFMTPSKTEIKGILFYTDTHYGHNLIELNKQVLQQVAKEKRCTAKCTDKTKIKVILTQIEQNKVSEHDLIEAIKELCKCRLCQRGMLEITITQMEEDKKFPFIKVGRLTLTYNNNAQLTNVQLEHCAEYNTDEE